MDEDPGLVARAEHVLAAARRGARSLATAESCTGGLVGHLLTEVPGSSDVFRGGIIAYADEVKQARLAVPAATLTAHGAVSAQTAVAMAEGARSALSADVAVAVTGIAGPDGGSTDKPVGLTYVAIADADGHAVQRYTWTGDRHANKVASAAAALDLLLERLEPSAR
ncbi:MAG: CinA family protein [Candidatus Limnocylindrales bacterium]|jgi:nicotinamide-nucleotide amidase